MSTFKALNIEYDEESDVEVDDTKEIQIEEALKLYQTALRYHAEGPSSFEAAAKAYQELFASEIFRYPESQNELKRIELYGAFEGDDASHEQLDNDVVVSTGLDAGPSTLPQILHLSHKNYAQFRLEQLGARLDEFQTTLASVLADASEALDHFVAALDKDDSDIDLWKKTARVGEVLDSRRVTRFCLEAVLDGDEEGLSSVLSLPGIEDGMAVQKLRSLVSGLGDYLSALQPGLVVQRRKVLLRYLKERVDSSDELTAKVHLIRDMSASAAQSLHLTRQALKCPQSWTELGDLLMQHKLDDQGKLSLQDPAITFEMPGGVDENRLIERSVDEMQIETETVAPDHAAAALEQDVDASVLQQPKSRSTQSPVENRRPSTATNGDNDIHAQGLPTRKRHSDDAAEEGRVKSKRLRARESIADPAEAKQSTHDANVQWEFDQHLNELQGADDWLYETAGAIFNKLDVLSFEGIRNVKAELAQATNGTAKTELSDYNVAQSELSGFLNGFSDHTAHHLLTPRDDFTLYSGRTTSEAEKAVGTGRASRETRQDRTPLLDQNLEHFVRSVNGSGETLDAVAADFIETMTSPDKLVSSEASYTAHLWPEQLKTIVVRILVAFDEAIYNRIGTAVRAYRARQPDETLERDSEDTVAFSRLQVQLQNIFELHLDVYCLIKRTNSGVDAETITLQGHRLDRWFEITREVNHALANDPYHHQDVELETRFLWATTFYIAALDDASQEHILVLMQDLHAHLTTSSLVIELPNNAVMSEVSTAVLDREMSRLTTREFFERIADMENSDAVSLIETVEPLLDALNARSRGASEVVAMSDSGSVSAELVLFLENKEFSEILQLWTRLLDAYTQVGYQPMVLRTQLRMIRLVLGQIRDGQLELTSPADRAALLLSAIRAINALTERCLKLITSHEDAFDCLDEQVLRASITTFGEVLRLLQAFNVFEDPIRIGKTHPPTTSNGAPSPSFQSSCKMLHEMQLRVWIVLYHLLKEAMQQNKESFTTPLEDRFDFLRALHRNLGIRAICGGLDNFFVKMCKDEFFTMTNVDGYDSEQAQVLYDLYGLNCFLNPSYELMDHHCIPYDVLDRAVAQQSVDLLLAQADRLPIKELVKHTLKDAIDKVHGALSRKRPTESILRNREVIRALLRSPINPLNLYLCLKGEGNQLDMSPVPESDASLAANGWYFLMGHISLTKFRTMKRTGQTPTEDVDIAIAFFMQELEYSATRWETWFRLAQAYDTKVEECVVWSAEKLNSSMSDVSHLQKAAIHCYTMATALAYRSADLAFETSDKMTELYSEFAMRMYSSTRQPFGMLPFDTDGVEKFLSRRTGLTKCNAFEPLSKYTAWKIAVVLFRRALAGNSKQWNWHYMASKCLWKMYSTTDDLRSKSTLPTVSDVLSPLYRAIELVPGKKDTRDNKREPVLEPHYKLVSLVHKLVLRGDMTLPQAQEALAKTHFVRAIKFPSSHEEWLPYILSVLRHLRAADKSNWHHRMIARTAQITFTDPSEPDELVRAANTKHELTQQMFTKTMVLQVWRPEAERAGRHFVYTARYTKFFVHILELLKDRANLEMLARRVRRRPNEIFEHSAVWQDIISAYLRLLRERGQLQEGLETSAFSNIVHEEFVLRKEPLEKWMQTQEEGSHIVLDVLREVTELKKINANGMKTGPIDDLIGDAYAFLYSTVGKGLWDEHQLTELKKQQSPEANIENTVNNPMHIASILSLDGASGTSTKPEPTPEPEAAPTKRRMGIGRREIRSAAEACLHKAATSASKAQAPVEKARAASVMKPEQSSEQVMDTSAPGSVVDDADDESELSELEDAGTEGSLGGGEQDASKPVFPGLSGNETLDDEDNEEDTTRLDATLIAGSAPEGQDTSVV
ncbi:hypothetical protein AMS68_000809 [Peltaster fructicola]|uniref:Histone transcription regulator 3 homolog n=1 Tax=Peltaster fructicola TaxID=286661 RepID=A0A6H0XKN0_9PEZI|nr:hypothetical protein AMS68_000809 [Peltaster fructicola]